MVALLDSTGGRRETIAYSAYGTPFGRPGADVNGDGTVTALGDTLAGRIGQSYGDANYGVRWDINLDGTIDSTDSGIKSAQTGYTLGHGALSRDPSLTGGVGNRLGYAGYAWEASSSKYHVRHRVLDPLRGRWSRRDPLGYVDSPTLFAYVNNRALTALDPTGLLSLQVLKPEQLPMDRKEGPKYGCAPYSELGADGTAPNNPGCPMGGGVGQNIPGWTPPATDCTYDNPPPLTPEQLPCYNNNDPQFELQDSYCRNQWCKTIGFRDAVRGFGCAIVTQWGSCYDPASFAFMDCCRYATWGQMSHCNALARSEMSKCNANNGYYPHCALCRATVAVAVAGGCLIPNFLICGGNPVCIIILELVCAAGGANLPYCSDNGWCP